MRAATLAVLALGFVGGLPACWAPRPMMATPEWQQRPRLNTSLFKADQQAMDEETVARVLSSKPVLPRKARMALMRLPSPREQKSHWGSFYWRDEAYLKAQQAYWDTLCSRLTCDRVEEVVTLPELMTPTDAGIPVLREAAVRLQADLLLVFRTTSDVYYRYGFRFWDKAKGFCTCELVLLDVRTGIVPFTTVVTRDKAVGRVSSDYDTEELMQRAEKEAVLEALTAAAQQVTDFLRAVP